jgi:hypothetical protein
MFMPRLEELYRACELATQRFQEAAFTTLDTSLEERGASASGEPASRAVARSDSV